MKCEFCGAPATVRAVDAWEETVYETCRACVPDTCRLEPVRAPSLTERAFARMVAELDRAAGAGF